MAAQRPVAAQIVSVANSDDTSARALSRILAVGRRAGQPGDEAGQLRLLRHARPGDLAAVRRHRRRLHDRAHHGDGRADQPRRRVAAARELLGRDAPAWRWPPRRWRPRFGERPQDSLCLGLLAQMGAALLHHNDPDGYEEIVAAQPTFRGRRAAEIRRYGINSLRLTSVALEQWGFPATLTTAAQGDRRLPDRSTARCSGRPSRWPPRLTTEDYEEVPIAPAHLRPARRGRPRAGAGPGARRRRRAAPRDARGVDRSGRLRRLGRSSQPPRSRTEARTPSGRYRKPTGSVAQAYGAPSGSTVS